MGVSVGVGGRDGLNSNEDTWRFTAKGLGGAHGQERTQRDRQGSGAPVRSMPQSPAELEAGLVIRRQGGSLAKHTQQASCSTWTRQRGSGKPPVGPGPAAEPDRAGTRRPSRSVSGGLRLQEPRPQGSPG